MADNVKELKLTETSGEIKSQIDAFVDYCIIFCNDPNNSTQSLFTLPIPDFIFKFPTKYNQHIILRIIHKELYDKSNIVLNVTTCSKLKYACGCDKGFGVSINNFLFGEPLCTKNISLEKITPLNYLQHSKKN